MISQEVRQLRAQFEDSGKGHLFHNVMLFSRVLREIGLDANPTRTIDLLRCLDFINIGQKEDFYEAGKAIMVRGPEEIPLYDYVFQMFWRRWPTKEELDSNQNVMPPDYLGKQEQAGDREKKNPLPPQERNADENDRQNATEETQTVKRLVENQVDTAAEEANDDSDAEKQQTYSSSDVMQNKDFQDFTTDELEEAKRLMSELRWSLAMRPTRRLTPARHGRKLDARRTVRRSLKYGGTPMELAWRNRKMKPRPLVVIADISGSMDLYSRLLLQFMHSLKQGLKYVETFVFGTRLTRITYELKSKNVDDALTAVSKNVKDWAGGTRIGESLETFNVRWARRVMGHGSIVIIISDGWDRGDVEVLKRSMARLQRLSFRLIWLNPLLGMDDYQPLTIGIQAALQYVDDFLPAHNFRSLQELGILLANIGEEGRPDRKQAAH